MKLAGKMRSDSFSCTVSDAMTMKCIVHTVSSKKQLFPEIGWMGALNDNLYSVIVTTDPNYYNQKAV